LGKIDEEILEVLKKAGKPLTLTEIAEHAGKPPKKIFSGIKKLFEAGKVDCDHKARTYALAKEQTQ
jgi:DNA-binding IclR family transcriptional regulator